MASLLSRIPVSTPAAAPAHPAEQWSIVLPAQLRLQVIAANEKEAVEIIAALAGCGQFIKVTLPGAQKASLRLVL